MPQVIKRFQMALLGLRSRSLSRSKPVRASVDAAPRAMAVVGEGPARDALQAVFREAGWKLVIADTPALALTRQELEPLPIILYERELAERSWRQVVSRFSRLSPRPCVVLLSRSLDKNLWDELVRCGGFDLLRTPVDHDSAIRIVRDGWAIWQGRHNPRLAAATNRS